MMDWTVQIDAYCERTDFTFWAEPVNALTNGFYLLGGVFMLWRVWRDGLPVARILSLLLIAIAIGSFLFHTLATRWAAASDTIPIVLFIIVYLFAVARDFLGLKPWIAAMVTAAFVPFAAIVVPILNLVPFLAISNFYWTVPILLLGFAPLVARHRRATARGMVLAAAILSVSIVVRSFDEIVCDGLALGTHWLWHTLNAIMLPLVIEVYRRHMLEARRGRG